MSLDKVTVKVKLKTGKGWQKANGEYPVKLRVTFKGKQYFYTVGGENATKEEFELIMNPNSKGKRAEKRLKFTAIETKAREAIDRINNFTIEKFKVEYFGFSKRNVQTIHEYFESKISELEKESQFASAELYRATIKSITRFDTKASFDKITPKYLLRYENWFVTEGKTSQKKGENVEKKGGEYTTVGIYMRCLRHIVNRAINNNMPIEYPFGRREDGKYTIPEGDNKKKALTINEVAKLLEYETDNENELIALDYWFFSYLCNGMNMADILNLKFSDIKQGNIIFIRQKTRNTTKNKKYIRAKIIPEVQDIIDRIGNEPNPNNYIFPVYKDGYTEIERRKKRSLHIDYVNTYLKKIAHKVGIDENFTTYWARHTFSTVLKRLETPIQYISEQLGHQNLKVTENYLDSFEDEHRAKYTANLIPEKIRRKK